MVDDVTKNSSIPGWHERNEDYVGRLDTTDEEGSRYICAADKLYNLGSTIDDYRIMGPAVWQRFTTQSVADQVWYYDLVHGMLNRHLPDMALTRRLGGAIIELKEELSLV